MPIVVTLPFPAEELPNRPSEFIYNIYNAGDPIGDLAHSTFWVTPYLEAVDYGAVLTTMSRVKVVQTQSAGTEHVAPFLRPETILCNARGVHDAATAEFAVALILASLRQIPRFVRGQATGTWDGDNSGQSLADKSVLIVGYGSIGRALGRRLAGFDCHVTGISRRGGDDALPMTELRSQLGRADVVVMFTPLTSQTRHLVDASFLRRMKGGALLVNMARGGVVDQRALIRETKSGRLHAALDVTDPEPLPADHPLWAIDNVLVTPHAGGGTSAMVPRIRRLIETQLGKLAAGAQLDNVILR